MAHKVTVIGGGITGLAAAYRLQTLAREHSLPIDLTLIEREAHLGGKIATERVDGFVIEGGPDSFLAYKPGGMALCRELGLAERLHGTNPDQHKTFVMRNGQLRRLPAGLTGMIPTEFGPMVKTNLFSPLGKLRMALDFVLPARRDDDDESLASFISRRLGSEVYAWLIEPLMGGIYAGDAAQLSLAATFPQLRKLEQEHGGLIKGMLHRRRNMPKLPNKSSRSPFLTPRTGLAEMVEALAEQLSTAEILTGTGVEQVAPEGGGYRIVLDNGEARLADHVILATPAYVTARLVAAFDAVMANTLNEIPYVSTATVSLAYPLSDMPHPLDGYGYVIPRAEGGDVLACSWISTKFPHRSPEGQALLRVFIGRAGQQQALQGSHEDLVRLARDELARTLGITAAPAREWVYHWPQAMPQYNLGHLDRVARIEGCLEYHSGLALAGAAYHGIGIPDCISSGERAAHQIFDGITTPEMERENE